MTKICTTCKEEKQLDQFSTNKATADGKHYQCKACNKIHNDKWRNENKEYTNQYYHNTLKYSELYPVRVSITTLIRLAIRTKRYSPFKRTALILGCNCEDFLAHIESQFPEGMDWENRSEWHIDHIIPMDYAKTIDDVYILNHHTNLQPLWKSQNQEKHKSLPEGVEEKFLELKERNLFMKTLLGY